MSEIAIVRVMMYVFFASVARKSLMHVFFDIGCMPELVSEGICCIPIASYLLSRLNADASFRVCYSGVVQILYHIANHTPEQPAQSSSL